ncbi:MAG TPA: monofunctional biosynthetic peptidoglycan transglycosylase [Methyloceanibacter sp.]|nr:monofunctional biosynthetic peptidoglycan transglycosylase [Methyloceanibacter sp.]
MAVEAVVGERPRRRSRRRRNHPWLRLAGRILVVLAALVVLSIVAFRFINPPTTSVMVASLLRGNAVRQDWVPLGEISPELVRAVIASEDGRFCEHWGVDWSAVREAIKEGEGLSDFRGASTITMQTAKNLYLWNSRSYFRKALEVPLAYLMTLFWPKKRTIEVYLNIAQFGPGTFGAEAASRRFFNKSAANLTRREAVLLAVALPNPGFRNPAKPSARMLRIATVVERRLPILAPRSQCALPQR